MRQLMRRRKVPRTAGSDCHGVVSTSTLGGVPLPCEIGAAMEPGMYSMEVWMYPSVNTTLDVVKKFIIRWRSS